MTLRLRFWLLATVSFLLAFVLSANVTAQSSSPDELNQQGFKLLNNGAPTEAVSAWIQAEKLYREAGHQEGIVGTQINQAIAQQTLGLNSRACITLVEAIAISEQICQPQSGADLVASELAKIAPNSVNAIGLRVLGQGLGSLSNLEEALTVLRVAQDMVPEASIESSQILLTLGNIYSLRSQAALQDYERMGYRDPLTGEEKLSEIASDSRAAIALYDAASNTSDETLSIKTHANIIGVFAHIILSPDIQEEAFVKEIAQAARQSYVNLKTADFNQLPAIDAIYTRLNLADSLLAIKANSIYSLDELVSYADIEQLIQNAASTAERIDNYRALASVYGTAGDFLIQTNEPTTLATEQYGRALSAAQSIRASDLSYQWAYKLAKLSEKAQDAEKAEQYYQNAIAALSSVRNDLLAVDSEIRFSFREKVEPIYRDYIRFLVSKEEAKLDQAIQIHNSLQLAQLENYLRCGRLISAAKANDKATIHIINLDLTVEVIVSLRNQSRAYSIPATEVLLAAEGLIPYIQSETFFSVSEEEFLPYTQLLYDKLLRPAEEANWIPENAELSFVLDPPFQSIPMALLHDGQRYLIEKHPLSSSLQMSRLQSDVEGSEALFAGISTQAPSFADVDSFSNLSDLPETEFEEQYLSNYTSTEAFLNSEFTADRLRDEISKEDFSVVHISTHGQFSSVPEQTFLLAWDKPLGFLEIGRLFQSARGIDLLFLSACESAAGDERATLGLAGLAIQSSARNAIATLWAEDSESGAVLVNLFYEALAEDNSPAEALQRGQKILATSDTFRHPYYWASFILAAS